MLTIDDSYETRIEVRTNARGEVLYAPQCRKIVEGPQWLWQCWADASGAIWQFDDELEAREFIAKRQYTTHYI